MRLADAIDEFHLQRNDGHRGNRLRQQFERAVQYRRIEDHPVEFRGGHGRCGSDPSGLHAGGRQWHRCQLVGIDSGLDNGRLVQPEAIAKFGKEACLRLVAQPVDVADAHRELERQPA